MARPGIRASLLLGFGAMQLIIMVTAAIALIATYRISESTRSLVASQIPDTVEVLRVAQTTDALVLASGQLDSVNTAAELDALVRRIRGSQSALEDSLTELEDSPIDIDEVQQHTSRLEDNLAVLTAMADQRIVLQARADDALQRIRDNYQEMNQQLVHRMRILQSDGDVLRQLLTRAETPVETAMRVAGNLAAQVPTARFFMLMEQAHSSLLDIAEAVTTVQLDLQTQLLNQTVSLADRSFQTLTDDVRTDILPVFDELQAMLDSNGGMPAIREEQIRVTGEIDALIAENLRLQEAVETSTEALMGVGMQGIEQAAQDADTQRRMYSRTLMIPLLLGLLLVGLLVFFYINRYLIHRLGMLSRAMRDISHGRFETRLPPAGEDELGQLGEAVHVFQQAAMEAASRGRALEKANRKLQDLAWMDTVTGIANRRHFDRTIEDEYARARRMNLPLSLIFMDIDHFKHFNDQYGHQAGDACLARIGATLRTMFRRAGELPARYGGEEFCVILPGREPGNAAAMAEAVRTAVMALDIPNTASEHDVVTVSVGVASAPKPEGESSEQLVRLADQAMYDAKRGGRNTVVSVVA